MKAGTLAAAKERFLQAAKGDADWVETTRQYVGELRSEGFVTFACDGAVSGVAADGTRVSLGHILAVTERQDWARLGDYLAKCPLPEDW